MKRIFFIAFTFILAHLAVAGPQTAALEKRITALSQAMITADAKALKAITASTLSYGHSSGRVEDQQTFINNLVNGSSDFVTIDLQDQTISLADDIAIVRHVLAAETNDSGKPGSVKIGVMLVWQEHHGEWTLLARQAFKL
jgi:hypothetical protein